MKGKRKHPLTVLNVKELSSVPYTPSASRGVQVLSMWSWPLADGGMNHFWVAEKVAVTLYNEWIKTKKPRNTYFSALFGLGEKI